MLVMRYMGTQAAQVAIENAGRKFSEQRSFMPIQKLFILNNFYFKKKMY